jgi:hypothetical protein
LIEFPQLWLLALFDSKPIHIIELKLSEDTPNKNFFYFSRYFTGAKQIKLVKDLTREKTYPDGIEVRSFVSWLSTMNLQA